MIPKVIHYCWFGGNPLPESAKKCINSWRKFLPDYEIKEWNENNFDVNSIPYTRDAYAAKKYAFISDYARFWILYHHGGIYFDTDVQVLKPMDNIIAKGNFMGREAGAYIRDMGLGDGNGLAVNPGIGFGMEKSSPLLEEILTEYNSYRFVRKDGTLNMKTIVAYTTEHLFLHGLSHNNDTPEFIAGVWIYPPDVFCPMDHTKGNVVNITERTVSIHLYDCSWLDKNTFSYKMHVLKNKLSKILGAKFVSKVADIIKGR